MRKEGLEHPAHNLVMRSCMTESNQICIIKIIKIVIIRSKVWILYVNFTRKSRFWNLGAAVSLWAFGDGSGGDGGNGRAVVSIVEAVPQC